MKNIIICNADKKRCNILLKQINTKCIPLSLIHIFNDISLVAQVVVFRNTRAFDWYFPTNRSKALVLRNTTTCATNDISSVSYTHLDVYKRQVLICFKSMLHLFLSALHIIMFFIIYVFCYRGIHTD